VPTTKFIDEVLYICEMSNIKVKIINRSPHPLPAYATEGSAGMDLRANLPGPVELQPLERQMIPTGIYIELPPGFEAQVRPRSGLAAKQGITCLNSPGTVDSDYRGELKVILINLSSSLQVLHPGDRIAQLVVGPVTRVDWEEVEEIGMTARNAGGFGHTGKS
jgi:dUTP pyrophosphatase